MNGELDVGPPGLNPDFPDNVDGRIPHGLVFSIREGLGRRHGNTVPGVDTHGIEIFNGTDNHHVVLEIPHDLQFIFFPANQGLLDDHFRNHAGIEPGLCNAFHLLAVVGHATADPPQGKAGTNNDGISDFGSRLPGLVHVPGNPVFWNPQTNAAHGIAELLPVFRLEDHRQGCTNHLHPQPLQNTCLSHLHSHVKTRLASQGREDGIRPLPLYHFFKYLRCNGFHVGAVGRLGVGHDRGGIAVDEDHLEALFHKGFTGLGTGIVKLTGLPDDDGAGTDDEDLLYVCSFWHECCDALCN